MQIGAILTTREVEAIRQRLVKIQYGEATPHRIREQARLVHCAIKAAERRAGRIINKTEPKLF